MSSESAQRELHLISRIGDQGTWRVVAAGARAGRPVTVVLWGEAVLETPEAVRRLLAGGDLVGHVTVVARARDCSDLGIDGRWPTVSPEEVVDLLTGCQRVASW